MRKEQGITLVGMLSLIVIIICLGVLLMRVVPVYIDNYEVRQSIEALHDLQASNFSTDPMANVTVLRTKLMNQLSVNGIYDIKSEQVTITPANAGVYLIAIHYVVIKPLVYNVSLMFDFNESEEVIVGPK